MSKSTEAAGARPGMFHICCSILVLITAAKWVCNNVLRDDRAEFVAVCVKLDDWFTNGGVTDDVIEENLRELGTSITRIQKSSTWSSERAELERIAEVAGYCANALHDAPNSADSVKRFAEYRSRLKVMLRDFLARESSKQDKPAEPEPARKNINDTTL